MESDKFYIVENGLYLTDEYSMEDDYCCGPDPRIKIFRSRQRAVEYVIAETGVAPNDDGTATIYYPTGIEGYVSAPCERVYSILEQTFDD